MFCPNPNCFYLQEYTKENIIHFDKNGNCGICGASGVFNACEVRKYTGFKGNTAHIFHVGSHTCVPRDVCKRSSEIVSKALSIDPNSKPSTIQSSAVLTALRERKSWSEIKEITTKVANRKRISNKKIKQRKVFEPKENSFNGVQELKEWSDQEDKFLIYEIDQNQQYVFNSSKVKMKLAKHVDVQSAHYWEKEFCFFDGKHGLGVLMNL